MADVKRRYEAPRRAASAAATRRAVLAAAAELFTARGWAATSVDEIARAAGVSRPTVFGVGTKVELLRLCRDLAMAGDDEDRPVAARQPWQDFLAEPDLDAALRRFAVHVAGVAERYGDLDEVLRQGAGADPDLRRLWDTSEEQRLQGARLALAALREKGPLAVADEEALDVLWLLMAPDHHRRLVRVRGWTTERYARWLGSALVRLLVPGGAGLDR